MRSELTPCRARSAPWSHAALAALAALALGACGGDDDGPAEEDTSEPDIAEPDTGEPEPDVPAGFSGPCPGVERVGTTRCEAALYGSGDCVVSQEPGCADLAVTLACLDANGDKYHDDIPADPIYVDKDVAFGAGKGTLAEPFASISSAVAAASAGDTIVVVAAQYNEQVIIEGKEDLTLLGPGGCSSGGRARVRPPSGPALTIRDSRRVRVEGLDLGAGSGGALIDGGSEDITLEHIEVAASGGVGVAVRDASTAQVTLRRVLARDTPGVCAVIVDGARDVAIDEVELRTPVVNGLCARDAVGLTVTGATITGAGAAGMTLVDSTVTVHRTTVRGADDGGLVVSGSGAEVMIEGARLVSNGGTGLLLDGVGSADVKQTYVGRTVGSPPGAASYGIAILDGGPQVSLRHVRVDASNRVGIGVFGPATGTPEPPPPAPGAPALELDQIAVTASVGAGIAAFGAVNLRVVDSAVNGVAADTGADGAADGISVTATAMSVVGASVRNVARYGIAFDQSTGRIERAVVDVQPDSQAIVCSVGVCNMLNFVDGGAAQGNAQGLPLPYPRPNPASVLPSL